jgi:hypothetical protein
MDFKSLVLYHHRHTLTPELTLLVPKKNGCLSFLAIETQKIISFFENAGETF